MADDKLKQSVEQQTNLQGLELISRDLDKPVHKRPSSDQYMREHGYPNRFDVPEELRAPKKGSYTVPKMCGGGKVLKSWSK